jgi:hypothetical protein
MGTWVASVADLVPGTRVVLEARVAVEAKVPERNPPVGVPWAPAIGWLVGWSNL